MVLVPLACEDESSFALLASTFNLSCSFAARMDNWFYCLLPPCHLPWLVCAPIHLLSVIRVAKITTFCRVPGQTELLALLLLSFH